MGKRYRSSIPANAIERVICPYRRKGGAIWLRKTECSVGGVVVGERSYDKNGSLLIETPLRHGKKHGVQFNWYEGGGCLESAEPFHNGLPQGMASQWDQDGKLIGTYTLNHGSGLDLWRGGQCSDGSIYLAEVHSLKDGEPHGYEQWLNEDQRSVWRECHFHEGRLHGIEREWSANRRLKRWYPRYYIKGERVTKWAYVKACRSDPNLPAFRAVDNKPERRFPPKITRELKPRS